MSIVADVTTAETNNNNRDYIVFINIFRGREATTGNASALRRLLRLLTGRKYGVFDCVMAEITL